jgi:hypothetical protein
MYASSSLYKDFLILSHFTRNENCGQILVKLTFSSCDMRTYKWSDRNGKVNMRIFLNFRCERSTNSVYALKSHTAKPSLTSVSYRGQRNDPYSFLGSNVTKILWST